MDLHGKNILIIGSGADIAGRRMGRDIDAGKWDIVIRLNKHYGEPQDCGTRTDIWITRWRSWIGNITPRENKPYVVLNEHIGISPQEYQIILEELGHTAASCGLLAVAWCLHRGARSISVIGYGYYPQIYAFCPKQYLQQYDEKKKLPVSRFGVDCNPRYDWVREARYLLNNNINLL